MKSLRDLYRRLVPVRIRQLVRRVAREIPIRLRDLPADLRERLTANGGPPLPPARLREHVGIDSSRAHFERIGRRAATDLAGIVAEHVDLAAYPRWLDFGCGPGRVARHLAFRPEIRHLAGVDVDKHAVAWASRHLPGEFLHVASEPPMPFPASSFDVVYAVSVFTHFDERSQHSWLAELHRLLRDGGLLVATTHGPHLTYNRPDLTKDDHVRLRDTGFAFRSGSGSFNEDSAFHSRAYMEREWSPYFELIAFRPSGLVDYLDLSLWRQKS